MKKKIYLITLVFSLFLICVTYIAFKEYIFKEYKYEFICMQDGKQYKIKPYYVEEENCYYVFLPNFESDKIQVSTNCTMNINNAVYKDGANIKNIEMNQKYNFIVEDIKQNKILDGQIEFVKQTNIKTIYIETATKSMYNIYENMAEEKARMLLIDSNGNTMYEGNLDYIKGRGNSSWETEKKSFNIGLNDAINLLEMGKSQKWCLIASVFDPSNIRNKLVYDFGKNIGMENYINSEFVELYLNGEYSGLYLLCEKNELKMEKLNIDQQNFSNDATPFFIEKKFIERYKASRLPGFVSENEIAFQIRYPKNPTNEQISYIEDLWQKTENLAYENNNEIFDYIDLDSWVKYYLIQEIFQNFDSINESIYFYKKPNDQKIYAGPTWDFDIAMGSNVGKAIFGYREATEDYVTNTEGFIWDKLMENELFYNEVKKQFYNEFIPKINELINQGIDNYKSNVYEASKRNFIRYNNHMTFRNIDFMYLDREQFKTDFSMVENCNYIKEFLSKRINFLKQEWKE